MRETGTHHGPHSDGALSRVDITTSVRALHQLPNNHFIFNDFITHLKLTNIPLEMHCAVCRLCGIVAQGWMPAACEDGGCSGDREVCKPDFTNGIRSLSIRRSTATSVFVCPAETFSRGLALWRQSSFSGRPGTLWDSTKWVSESMSRCARTFRFCT